VGALHFPSHCNVTLAKKIDCFVWGGFNRLLKCVVFVLGKVAQHFPSRHTLRLILDRGDQALT